MPRLSTILVGGVMVALLTGCGGPYVENKGQIEAVLYDYIKERTKMGSGNVACPDKIEAKAGTTFQCSYSTRTWFDKNRDRVVPQKLTVTLTDGSGKNFSFEFGGAKVDVVDGKVPQPYIEPLP